MINTKFRDTQLEYVANNIDIQESIPNNFSQDKISKSEFNKMLKEISLSNISEYEKKLFFTIIEDKYITTKEAESLTYEQIKKIKDLILEKDKKGEYIEASFINASYKANALMFSAMVSDDEDFNKAFHNILKSLNKTKDILNFMILVAGVTDPATIVGFDEYLNTEYGFKQIKRDDLNFYLEENIDDLKENLNKSINDSLKEYYKEALSYYIKLKEYYAIEKNDSHKKWQEDKILNYLDIR